jgi:hypothetical protein
MSFLRLALMGARDILVKDLQKREKRTTRDLRMQKELASMEDGCVIREGLY